jgi:hypothetical protein
LLGGRASQRAESLRKLVAADLGCPVDSLQWINAQDILVHGKGRYLMGLREGGDGDPDGFVKVALSDERKRWLANESVGMTLAIESGVPTAVGILTSYHETNGLGIFEVERIDATRGFFLKLLPELGSVDPNLGAIMARTLVRSSGLPIPESAGGLSSWSDSRTDSAGAFRTGIADARKAVLPWLERDGERYGCSAGALGEALDAALTSIGALVTEPGAKYGNFAHNDAAPTNFMFTTDGNGRAIDAEMIDFEYSGVAANRTLAQISDFGTAYGRSWANPAMQRALIGELFTVLAGSDGPARAEAVVRAAAVIGSLLTVRKAMEPSYREHARAISLLGNLERNVDHLAEVVARNRPHLSGSDGGLS